MGISDAIMGGSLGGGLGLGSVYGVPYYAILTVIVLIAAYCYYKKDTMSVAGQMVESICSGPANLNAVAEARGLVAANALDQGTNTCGIRLRNIADGDVHIATERVQRRLNEIAGVPLGPKSPGLTAAMAAHTAPQHAVQAVAASVAAKTYANRAVLATTVREHATAVAAAHEAATNAVVHAKQAEEAAKPHEAVHVAVAKSAAKVAVAHATIAASQPKPAAGKPVSQAEGLLKATGSPQYRAAPGVKAPDHLTESHMVKLLHETGTRVA